MSGAIKIRLCALKNQCETAAHRIAAVLKAADREVEASSWQ
jgi:hypothetical protein